MRNEKEFLVVCFSTIMRCHIYRFCLVFFHSFFLLLFELFFLFVLLAFSFSHSAHYIPFPQKAQYRITVYHLNLFCRRYFTLVELLKQDASYMIHLKNGVVRKKHCYNKLKYLIYMGRKGKWYQNRSAHILKLWRHIHIKPSKKVVTIFRPVFTTLLLKY